MRINYYRKTAYEPADAMLRPQAIERARTLRRQRLTLQEIAYALKLTTGAVRELLAEGS